MNLNKRQRAMLQDMGVTVWQPLPEELDVPAPAARPATVRPTSKVGLPAQVVSSRTPTVAMPAATPAPTPALQARPTGVERMDWATLQSTVASCQACTLCHGRKNTVFGTGAPAPEGQTPQADWLIVGEAPGEQEDRQGLPFVGPAGQLLDNMLRALGLERASPTKAGSVYIANVLKCRPPSNRAPQPEEIAQCQPYLQRQIELLQPKIILALGRFAAQTLLAASVPDVLQTPLGKLRGRIYPCQGVPVVVSYHPAYLLRNLPDKAKAWDDWCLALSVFSKGHS